VPVIKPLDTQTVIAAVRAVSAVITAENHSVIGGLGSAVAETMAEAGLGRPLRRVGLRDTFAEGARTPPFLFKKYGLGTQDIVDRAWELLHRDGPPPRVPVTEVAAGEYAPV
jgi:transketolase